MVRILKKMYDAILSPFSLRMESLIDLRDSHISKIDENIYLGERPDESKLHDFKNIGITHIVSCLDKEYSSSVDFLKEDFTHIFLAMRDGINENIEPVLSRFFEFTDNMDIKKSKLFIHCESGVSRSATLAISKIMEQEKMPFYDSYRVVKLKRARIHPNIGFASQLQKLEFDILGKKKNDLPSSLAFYLCNDCRCPVDVETMESMLIDHDYDAAKAIMTIFGGEIPRVVQGVRLCSLD